MREDKFQKAMEAWAESELESAPDLRPTAEMVRLVRARGAPRRALALSSRWAAAGAAVAGLLVIAILSVLLLRPGGLPGPLPTPAGMLVAQRPGRGAVQTAALLGGGKGPGEKGVGGAPAVFRQFVLEYRPQDSPAVQMVDLLHPPAENLVLTPADDYRLLLEPAEAGYVYVHQLTAAGRPVPLFPNPAYSAATNPLPAGRLVLLPAEPNWLYLDGEPGEERLYVVASHVPLPDLDDLYARYSGDEILPALLEMLEPISAAHPGRAVAVEFTFQHR